MTWNPQARRSQTFDIDASRDENGTAQARVTMTAWTASDRLAYMDLAGRSIRKAPDGSRVADVGAITLDHIARTLTSAEGFGDITYTDPQRGHTVTQAFDPRRREHLEALSADVLEELAEYAEEVQPTKRKAKAVDGDLGRTSDDDDGEPDIPPVPADTAEAPAADDEDPSRAL